MTPASAKAKGRKFQQQIAQDLQRVFDLPASDVVSRPMGSGGDDLMLSAAAERAFLPAAIECKHVEALNVWQAYAQVEARAAEGKLPLLVFRRNRSEPMVALKWSDFLMLVKLRSLL